MAAEIREQPDVFERILGEGMEAIRSVARVIQERSPRFVLFAARGTSDHAALYAKYLVETRLGLPAGLVSPSSMTVYGAHPTMQDVLFVAVSQSGASPDLVDPLERARMGGALTVAVTNDQTSPLGLAAEWRLDILAGPELAVAATKTYTAELFTLYLLVQAVGGESLQDDRDLPERMRTILDREDEVARLAERYRFADRMVVTARGYNYATARETALKLMETTYVVAEAFSGADLMHGPMAVVHAGFPVVAVVPPGRGGQALQPVLERLRQQRADILVVGDAEAVRQGTVGLALTAVQQEVTSPILLILPMQQLAQHMALLRGIDPDRPDGLSKVTETW